METTDLLYLPREFGERGLKSIESTYKNISVKTATYCMQMKIQLCA